MARAPEGFEERFDELARVAYRVAYRLTGDREDARDIAQESLARAYARWRRIRDYAEAWVARVATNLALSQLRRRPLPVDAALVDCSDGIDQLAERDRLGRALRGLPKRQRETVALRFIADLSEADVARSLGCSVGTVKSQTHRALSSLRSHLDRSFDLAGETA